MACRGAMPRATAFRSSTSRCPLTRSLARRSSETSMHSCVLAKGISARRSREALPSRTCIHMPRKYFSSASSAVRLSWSVPHSGVDVLDQVGPDQARAVAVDALPETFGHLDLLFDDGVVGQDPSHVHHLAQGHETVVPEQALDRPPPR